MNPCVVQIFWPLMTHSSPSSTALVDSPARSEPASGSLKPWHHAISPDRILGRKNFFCSSVPHCRIVGPTSVSPKKSARSGAPARANSSLSTTASMVDRPLPPYSLGPGGADPAALEQLPGPVLVELHLGLGVHLEAGLEPPLGQVLVEPLADLEAEGLGFGGIGQIHAPILTATLDRIGQAPRETPRDEGKSTLLALRSASLGGRLRHPGVTV